MKFTVAKPVILHGKSYETGTELDLDPTTNARLIMLGYLVESGSSSNRAVALDSESKPRTRTKSSKKSED